MEDRQCINSHLKSMQENEKHKDELLKQIKEEVKAKYGDILDDYFLPQNFEFGLVDENDVIESHLQQDRLPFTNDQIKEMIDMPKQAINDSYNLYADGKHVHGTFLIGTLNGKHALFSLKIEKPRKYDDDFADFHIKLDILVGGQTWFELLRIDSQGNEHPNYIKDGNVVSSFDEVEKANPPHIHITNHECQILAGNHKYSLAYQTDKYLNLANIDNKDLFKSHMQKFIKMANIDLEINKNISDDWHFKINNPLFDMENVKYADNLQDLER